MTVVIPIAYSDSKHLAAFTEVLAHFGPYPEDSALILPTPEMAMTPEVSRHIETICSCFGGRKGDMESGRAVVQILQNDLQRGWPLGPNMHFENAVWFMNEFFPDQEWLWLETDCYGTTPYWLTTLKQAYRMAGTPYMGWTEDSYEIQNRGGKPTRVLMEGKHMAGPGFYPPGYSRRMGPNGAPNVMWKTQDRMYPFTIACRWEHRPVNHTPLICHKPRTVNWRIEDGELKCDDTADKNPLDISRAGVVDLTNVVFLHGPKDDSLAKLILSGDLDQFTGNRLKTSPKAARIPVTNTPAATPVQATSPAPQAAAVPPPVRFSDIQPDTPEALALQWLSETKREWQDKSGHTDPEIFMDQLTSGLEVARRHMIPAQIEPAVTESTEEVQTTSVPPKGTDTVNLVLAKLAAGNVQLAALAKDMGRDKKELKDELAAAGFTFAGPPQWVKAPKTAAA